MNDDKVISSLTRILFLALFMVWLFGGYSSAQAMDDVEKMEFSRILHMQMGQLTKHAIEVFEKKYPEEDWSTQNFPSYVYNNASSEVGYMIAVKNPNILKKVSCACFCWSKGHKNLLYCFYKDGEHGNEFDEHASWCNVCNRQAMMTFLWAEMGATDKEITKGMEELSKQK